MFAPSDNLYISVISTVSSLVWAIGLGRMWVICSNGKANGTYRQHNIINPFLQQTYNLPKDKLKLAK